MKPLSCPFCGSTGAEVFSVHFMGTSHHVAYVECVCVCGAHGPVRTASNKTRAEEAAVAAWNKAHGSYDRSEPDILGKVGQ